MLLGLVQHLCAHTCRSQWSPDHSHQNGSLTASVAVTPTTTAHPPQPRITVLGSWFAGLILVTVQSVTNLLYTFVFVICIYLTNGFAIQVCTTVMCLCSAVTAFILYVRPLLQVRSHRFLLCWLLTGLRCKLLRLLCWNSTPTQAELAGFPLSHAAPSWQVPLVPVAGNSGA